MQPGAQPVRASAGESVSIRWIGARSQGLPADQPMAGLPSTDDWAAVRPSSVKPALAGSSEWGSVGERPFSAS